MELYDKEGIAGVIPCTSLMEERLLPLVLTGEERTFEEWSRFLYWKYRNNGLAGETVREIGRFEFALLDLISKRAGLPAHRFLGSDKDWVPVYGSGGSTHLEGLSLAKEMGLTAICRNFAPLYGIDEESATGTSNCALACYLYQYGLRQSRYVFEQGHNLNSISRIYVHVEGDSHAVSGVRVGGYGYVEGSKTAAV